MKAMLRTVRNQDKVYDVLLVCCPGCAEEGGSGINMLPVNTNVVSPEWSWNGNLKKPTLFPSILTNGGSETKPYRCHSYLQDGVFKFLDDCTHSLAGKDVEMLDLPDWMMDDTEEESGKSEE